MRKQKRYVPPSRCSSYRSSEVDADITLSLWSRLSVSLVKKLILNLNSHEINSNIANLLCQIKYQTIQWWWINYYLTAKCMHWYWYEVKGFPFAEECWNNSHLEKIKISLCFYYDRFVYYINNKNIRTSFFNINIFLHCLKINTKSVSHYHSE